MNLLMWLVGRDGASQWISLECPDMLLLLPFFRPRPPPLDVEDEEGNAIFLGFVAEIKCFAATAFPHFV